MKQTLFSFIMIAAIAGMHSCSADSDEQIASSRTTINVGVNAATRAAQALNLDKYTAKLYLYEGDDATDYSWTKELTLTSNQVTLDGLTSGNYYKVVLMALPIGQTPDLPAYSEEDTKPSYQNATAQYISKAETDNDIFRSILSFKASTASSEQYAVLTRQNGALEVRISGIKDMQSVKLHLKGNTAMYLNDGTGGMVTTLGDMVELSKTITEGLTASEVCIRINLLPQEDITDTSGSDNYLEITTSTDTKTYPIKSDQPSIPIYPNQVTWLTLGNGNADFTVSFSNNINLEDNEWDGWNDNY